MDTVQISKDQIDLFTNYQVSISSDHAYIHQGKAFTLSGKSSSVAAAGTWVLEINTPDNKYVHLRPSMWSSTANVGELRIAEGGTTSSGSAATPWNRNRNSQIFAAVTAKTGVTLSAEGAVLPYASVGTGGNPAKAGGGTNGEANEIVLKPSTKYTFRFENIGATTATVFYYTIFWYEEDMG